MRIFLFLAIFGIMLAAKAAPTEPPPMDLENSLSAWDGAERIRYEVVVHEAVSKQLLDNVELKLVVPESSVSLQRRSAEDSAYSAKTVRGTATLMDGSCPTAPSADTIRIP